MTLNREADRTLILFAYYFPPDSAIGGARPYRFYKYLKRLGYTVHVLTASEQPAGVGEDIEYIADPFLSGVRDFGWQIERANRRFFMPGVPGMRWAHHAAAAAQQYLRNRGGRAAILSTCPPFGTHYAAWRLARATSFPWIADFRDPFGGVSMNMTGFNSFHRVFFNWLEKRVIESANVVIANTDSMAEEWRQRYAAQAQKIHLIWNGFDPETPMPPKELPVREYKVLSHVGELYAGRTVTPVLESIGRLVDTHQLDPSTIKVRIIGPAKSSAIPGTEFLQKARSQGWLDLSSDSVSQQEARNIAQTSDGLLLIQPQSAVQVPGKLFEYLQIGRPILAYIKRDSPIERILSRSGLTYRCLYPDAPPQEMDGVVAEFFRLPSDAVSPSEWFREQFRAESQAQTLASLIESIRA